MPYLNLDLNFMEHNKTKRLRAILGPEAEIYVIRLWLHCGKLHTNDGVMKKHSEIEIESFIGWHGDKKKAVKALKYVGFIKRIKNGWACVDWRQHQGHLVAFSRRGKIAAKARWNKYASSIAKKQTSNAPTVPNRTEPNRTVPTEPNLPNREVATATDGGFREDQDLERPWLVRGDHFMKRIQDLDPDYCGWALQHLTSIGPDYRRALQKRIEQKQAESNR